MNITTLLLLGILLVSPVAADFCDGNYVVEAGNWDDVKIREGGTVKGHTYTWDDDLSGKSNRKIINDPTESGMPAGTKLHSPPSMKYDAGGVAVKYISWLAVYDVQYTYTVVCDGLTYTNNTASMSYKAAYHETPYIHHSDMNRHVDDVTVTPSDGGVKFCVWQHWTANDGDKYYSYGEKTIPAGIDNVQAWPTPKTTTTATLTNATMGCSLLEIDTPPGVLGYRIDAVSDDHTAFYERNFGMMQRNTTESGKEFFEIVKATTENGEGMSTFGQSKYLLPKGDYIISMIAYTPFEKIPITITMIHETEETEEVDRKGAFLSLISLLTMASGLYFMFRGL